MAFIAFMYNSVGGTENCKISIVKVTLEGFIAVVLCALECTRWPWNVYLRMLFSGVGRVYVPLVHVWWGLCTAKCFYACARFRVRQKRDPLNYEDGGGGRWHHGDQDRVRPEPPEVRDQALRHGERRKGQEEKRCFICGSCSHIMKECPKYRGRAGEQTGRHSNHMVSGCGF